MTPTVLTDADYQRIATLGGDQLARLYQFLTDRLRHVPGMELQNDNVDTVRLPPQTVDHVKALALRHGTTRSAVLREAVVEFTRRNPI